MRSSVAAAPLYKIISSPLLLLKNCSYLQSSSQLLSQSQYQSNETMAPCIDTSRADTSLQFSRELNRSQFHDSVYKSVKCLQPGLSEQDNCKPFGRNQIRTIHMVSVAEQLDQEDEELDYAIWYRMKEEARFDVDQEPILSSYYYTSILSQRSLGSALANHLAIKLGNSCIPSSTLSDIFAGVLEESPEIIRAVAEDLKAVKERDPACICYVHCFLNFKGFLACQAHRMAHKLWTQGRQVLALLIQNRVSEVFAVDIHPGAKIGHGILLDHATGLVVGETAVIGNNVSILHNVTLGGTGKMSGDRHPKIDDGVLIGAGTCILGNLKIGEGAKIGACSVVLKDVPARTTAVGNPARLLGGKENPVKHDKIPSLTMDHTSHIAEWSDYVI